MYAQDSIELLQNAGMDFTRHDENGIDILQFGELLMTSGLVLTEDIKWISFHSYYDFGYLIKIVTCLKLPLEEPEFFELLRTYFPCIYDVKYLMKSCENLRGGLNSLAKTLEVLFFFRLNYPASLFLANITNFIKPSLPPSDPTSIPTPNVLCLLHPALDGIFQARSSDPPRIWHSTYV